jgi:L-arabinose isomerase
MRNVAVTEGDKVEAELKFGFSVNTHGIGDLAAVISGVGKLEIDQLVERYYTAYTRTGNADDRAIREAARIELGLQQFLKKGKYKGFTDTFEDLHGLDQLPGIAVQRLLADGYGFAAEGDWKTAALVRACKVMGAGLPGGNGFMEDYTYHFEPGNELVLGSHMLEIDASLAANKPALDVHPLGIGGKADPARLVFNVAAGPALNASLIDMGNRFRLVVNEAEAVEPRHELPNLPVARVLWKPLPDMKTACTAWLLAGGAHHTCYSQNLSAGHLRDFADIAGIECLVIGAGTDLNQFKNELRWNEASYT